MLTRETKTEGRRRLMSKWLNAKLLEGKGMETVELQRQKNPKDIRTPTTIEPKFFNYLKKI